MSSSGERPRAPGRQPLLPGLDSEAPPPTSPVASRPVPRPGVELLTSQVSALSAALGTVLGAANSAVEKVGGLQAQLSRFEQSVAAQFGAVLRELTLLRAQVTGDHAPRITAVEQRTNGLPNGVKVAGKYGLAVALIPILEQLWPLVKQLLQP